MAAGCKPGSFAIQENKLVMGFVDIAEIFVSLQGESSYAGLGCFFVRLAGCNLRCGYCDTPAALVPAGNNVRIGEVVEQARESGMPIVEITGGEPLLQPGFADLAGELVRLAGVTLLVETNGSLDIGLIPRDAVTVMDVKCPGSGAADSFDADNIGRLRQQDEVKFVLADRRDYEFACDFLRKHALISRVRYVHFSPVAGRLDAAELGGWILEDRLPVRLQLQLHRILAMQ